MTIDIYGHDWSRILSQQEWIIFFNDPIRRLADCTNWSDLPQGSVKMADLHGDDPIDQLNS